MIVRRASLARPPPAARAPRAVEKGWRQCSSASNRRVTRLRSLKRAEEWVRTSGDYAWSGAADHAVHVCQQNWHRRLRDVYEMPAGWRMPTKRVVEAQRGSRPWEDRRSSADIIASMVRRAGTRVPRHA